MDLPIVLPIKKIIKETETHVTILFDYKLNFNPGQFIMLWLPRVDERPFTVSYWTEREFGITIEAKGKFTKKIVELKKGDKLGFRGPFGNGFEIGNYNNVCVIAGGCGMAPISPLIDELLKRNINTTIIQGAKSKNNLLFNRRYKDLTICTDDGSIGKKGFTTEIFENKLMEIKQNKEKMFDMVYSCGPEIMMKKVFDICQKNKLNCQMSLERYMRCGFGLCGACVCGKFRVCKEGPVFSNKILSEINDFGKKALLMNGKEVSLSEYFSWRCT